MCIVDTHILWCVCEGQRIPVGVLTPSLYVVPGSYVVNTFTCSAISTALELGTFL